MYVHANLEWTWKPEHAHATREVKRRYILFNLPRHISQLLAIFASEVAKHHDAVTTAELQCSTKRSPQPSCEIEDFVVTRVCKLGVVFGSHLLRGSNPVGASLQLSLRFRAEPTRWKQSEVYLSVAITSSNQCKVQYSAVQAAIPHT